MTATFHVIMIFFISHFLIAGFIDFHTNFNSRPNRTLCKQANGKELFAKKQKHI